MSDHLVIECSHLMLEPLNADFDGDTAAIYRLHSSAAKLELNFNSFMKRNIKYDHYDEMIHRIRHEALYAANVLMMNVMNDKPLILIDDFNELSNTYDVDINQPIKFENSIYSQGLLLLNSWCGFKTLKVRSKISAADISRLIYEHVAESNQRYHLQLHMLNQKLNYFISTHPKEIASIPFSKDMFISQDTKKLLGKLPNNPVIGHHIHSGLVNKMKESFDPNSRLSKLSTTKFNITQFARVICSIGYIANDKNVISNTPITGNVFNGLDQQSFWQTGSGTRKGIVDKNDLTPLSGFLERSMVVNLSPCEISEEDCGTVQYFTIELRSKQQINSLRKRYCLDNGNVVLFDEVINTIGHDKLIGKRYGFRSPITCASTNFKICRMCFGNYDLSSKYVGILAAQNVFSAITQLTMRSFHTSGSCTLPLDEEVVDFIKDHLIDIESADYQSVQDLKVMHGSKLIFDTNIPTRIIAPMIQFDGFESYNKNWIQFHDLQHSLNNADVGKVINDVNQIFKKDNNRSGVKTPEEVYEMLIDAILSINMIYSTFVEMILCNSYVCTNDKLYRYELQVNPNPKIKVRLGIRSLHTIISSLLGLLYEPNKKSILKLKDFKIDESKLGIYEKLWLM